MQSTRLGSRLQQLTQEDLDQWVEQARFQTARGRLPDYIPLLAKVDRSTVAIHIQTRDRCLRSGDVDRRFVLMSTIKPFVLLFLLEQLGMQAVFEHVGQRPSDQPFHSIAQLTVDRGYPRNPMINSGAIALAGLLVGIDGFSRCEQVRQWLNHLAGCHLTLDLAMLESVQSLSNESNRAIATMLYQSGYLTSGIELTLDTYNHLCCLSGTVEDLAKLGCSLALPHLQLCPQHQRTVNALMLTCGLYEASGESALRIGLPLKSGVSGTLLAVLPRVGAIAIYSPAIDMVGNSVAGLLILEKLVQQFNLSLFSCD